MVLLVLVQFSWMIQQQFSFNELNRIDDETIEIFLFHSSFSEQRETKEVEREGNKATKMKNYHL